MSVESNSGTAFCFRLPECQCVVPISPELYVLLNGAALLSATVFTRSPLVRARTLYSPPQTKSYYTMCLRLSLRMRYSALVGADIGFDRYEVRASFVGGRPEFVLSHTRLLRLCDSRIVSSQSSYRSLLTAGWRRLYKLVEDTLCCSLSRHGLCSSTRWLALPLLC